MPVEGFDTAQQFPIIAAIDEDLGIGLHTRSEHRQGPRSEELFLFLF